jgi:hypothetical protein
MNTAGLLRAFLCAVAMLGMATARVHAVVSYQLDNNAISTAFNASDGTEPRDGWVANEFTAVAGGEEITRVDFGVFTSTANSTADVVLYRVTDPGGNPALGATRLYTQSFTPLTGDGTNAFLQQITLTTPVLFNPGDHFLAAIFIADVIASPPNDVYPFLLDTSGNPTNSYWDRSNPDLFNLDNLSQARLVNLPFSPGGFAPGAGHVIIRAAGIPADGLATTAVPEPATLALGTCALVALVLALKRSRSLAVCVS